MGGAESQIASLVNYLKEDYDVSLITFKNKKTDFYKINEKIKRFYVNININKFFLSKIIFYINFIYRIRKLLINLKPNTIVSFLPVPSTIMLISSIGLKSKKIISIRNNPDFEKINFVWSFFFKFLKKKISKIVVQTKYLEKKIKKKFNNSKIYCIPNFISTPNIVSKKKKCFNTPKKEIYINSWKNLRSKRF